MAALALTFRFSKNGFAKEGCGINLGGINIAIFMFAFITYLCTLLYPLPICDIGG